MTAGAAVLVALALTAAARLGVTARAGNRLSWAGTDHDIAACPLLAATGVPCPFCGGIRSVAFALRGDARWLDYNFLWPIAIATLVIAGVWLTTRSAAGLRARLRANPLTSSLAAGTLTLVLFTAGELVALANIGSIRPG